MASSLISLLEDSTTPPPAFYCPISLELMTDPVTLSSGITYDRASIQSWLSAGHLTCPVTRQPLLPHPLFIPNHTLLRIIRSWCDAHSLRDNSGALLNLCISALPPDGRHVHLGPLCRDALFELGLCILSDDNNVNSVAELIPHEQAVCLLAKLISQHPSPKSFFRSLSPQFVGNLASSLARFFKQCNPSSSSLTLDILQSLCILCKASHSSFLTIAEVPPTALVHAVMEQLLHASLQGSTPICEKVLCLLEVLSSCAEGRAAIASHAFAVPTIAKFLRRSSGEVALEAAVVVLWKVCRYSGEEKVRWQAMAACVPSKLVLLMQASHCSGKARVKAGLLVRLLLGEAKSKAAATSK